MNFGLAFSFPFQDPDWAKKILLPAIISIIPLIGQIFLIGWALEITRRVIRHDPTPLPELDFASQFMEGLKAFVVGLVYTIPILILIIPITVASALMTNNGSESNTANSLIVIAMLCIEGLVFLYGILLAFILPAAYGNMLAKGELSAAFNLREVFGLVRAAPGAYLIVLVGMFITSILAQVGVIACGIGLLATVTYSLVVNSHLYGQAYNEATHNQGFARVY